MNTLTRDSFATDFAGFLNAEKLEARKVAAVIGCSAPTLDRLFKSESKPSDEMLRQAALLKELKFEKYAGLSESQKSELARNITVGASGVAGVGASVAAVSAAGIAGLGVTGITSGLAAIGGTMLGGLFVVAAIPLAVAGAGYGIYKGVQYVIDERALDDVAFNPKWELPPAASASNDEDQALALPVAA